MKSRSSTHKTESVRIQRSSIGNQKEPLHTALLLRHHCLNKTMIRIRFIDETLAAVVDGNDTRLGTVRDDMWKHNHLAVALFHL